MTVTVIPVGAEVLPVGAKVPFPIKKHETERKKRKNPLLVRESL